MNGLENSFYIGLRILKVSKQVNQQRENLNNLQVIFEVNSMFRGLDLRRGNYYYYYLHVTYYYYLN